MAWSSENSGLREWNAWRDSGSPPPDLSRVDLKHARLSGDGACAINLSEAYFRVADLKYADLRNAKLVRADLACAQLNGADLSHANLSYANLSRAEVCGADVVRADLSGAHLNGADLSNANLNGVNLSGAHLNNADLFNVNLSGANLSGTDLTGAHLGRTVFSLVDLSSVIGLQTCVHHNASSIDHFTLQSSGSLPPLFLRGVGLPDSLIEYLPSLLNQPIQFYSCFISYSSKDQELAGRIHADLQNKGVRCWFAPHDLKIGDKILDGIDTAIRLHEKVLLILSGDSVASDWVEDEVKKAFEEERTRQPKQTVLFPIRLDDAVMETKEAWAGLLRRDRNIGDFRRWKDHDSYKKSFDRLLRDLKRAK
jgi:uncharacterized protein YjbI with pentapeptide repeats